MRSSATGVQRHNFAKSINTTHASQSKTREVACRVRAGSLHSFSRQSLPPRVENPMASHPRSKGCRWLLAIVMTIGLHAPLCAQTPIPELMKRKVSQEGIEYLKKLNQRTPFGTK